MTSRNWQDSLQALLSLAVRAPSGDNTQPWRFTIDGTTHTIRIEVDPARDPSPMNSGQRMARIACGAVIENLTQLATERGSRPTRIGEDETSVTLAFDAIPSSPSAETPLERTIRQRCTNRRFYDGRPIDETTVARIEARGSMNGRVDARWVIARDEIHALSTLVAGGDSLLFAERELRQAFLANVRFDAPPREEVSEGLSLASLELGPMQRFGMRYMFPLPSALFAVSGGRLVAADHARKLVQSASGVAAILVDGEDASSDFLVGQAATRAWLALTEQGLAAQPIMSIPVLESILHSPRPELLGKIPRHRVESLAQELRDQFAPGTTMRVGFLLRFGFAQPPTGRTGRLPIVPAIVSS